MDIKTKLSEYKKVAIFGLGLTGKSSYKFFHKHGIETVCWDDNQQSKTDFQNEFPDAQVIHYDNWMDCSHIVVSPGIPIYFPKRHKIVEISKTNNIELTTDIEILYKLKKDEAKFICITGTNGKSTTTALINHILELSGFSVACGGNIGISSLDLPLDKEFYVLELSSFQLELLKEFRANIGVLLNITPDHLDRHGNIEEYTRIKAKIFEGQKEEDFAIIGVDNQITSWIYEEQRTDNISCTIGISANHEFENIRNIICCDEVSITDNYWIANFEIKENIYLKGKHNRENFCAAYAACRAAGAKGEEIVRIASSYAGLAHRMQFIGKFKNASFYNDSKATNADATRRALLALSNIFWLAGGIQKEGGVGSLVDNLENVRKVYLFGEAAEEFAVTLKNHVKIEIFKDMNSAFEKACKDALEFGEDADILLSPACASYDQFKNFEDRGNKFILLYNNLKN